MSNTTELLASLKDIQEPLAPSGTALWLIGLNLLIAALIGGLIYRRWSRQRQSWKREALRRIDQAEHTGGNAGLLQLASLLRQVMHMRIGTTSVPLTGQSWLQALDAEFSTRWFSQGRGQIFGDRLYQPMQLDREEFSLLCQTLKKHLRPLRYRQAEQTPAMADTPH